jgi:heme-degrading monooxygenase HmoA
MFVVIWRFRPAEGREADFIREYSETGSWGQLFRMAPGYLETELLKGADGWFLTLDRWKSEEAYEEFRRRFHRQYRRLDQECETLTAEEELVGYFSAFPFLPVTPYRSPSN